MPAPPLSADSAAWQIEVDDQRADLDAALDWAFAHRPALLDVVVTPDAPSPDSRSGLAWVPDLQPLAAWDELERTWRSS